MPWIAVTAETLAHGLLRDVRAENVGTLKGDIEDSLKRLEAAHYIVPKGDGVWEFLTGVKKSFEEEAVGVTVRQADRRRAVRKALAEVLRPVGKLNYREGLRSFDVIVRGDGEELQSGGDIILEIYSPLHVELQELSVEDLEQVESFSHPETVYWVSAESPDLVNHVTRAIRLDAVLEKWRSKASKTVEEREIVREKETEHVTRRGKIETALRVALMNGTIVWNGRAEELDGRTTTLNPIFNRCVGRVVPHVYPKFDLAAVKPNEEDIKAVLTMAAQTLCTLGATLDLFDDDGHLNQHSAVVEEIRGEVEQRAHRGGDLSGKALEAHFTGGDYGWHPVIVRVVLAAMFRTGMVSAKAENVNYTDYTAPAAQVLFTKVHPFRRAVFSYEEEEVVTPEELRQAQAELKVIFDAPRREETANALAEQIREEMKQWNDRAQRLVLQLRPAGYPIPEALESSQDLHRRVTRFRPPGKVVKALLENLEQVRTWHSQVQALYQFIRDKRLPVFRQARGLLKAIERAEGVPDTEPLSKKDAQRWREQLQELVTSGQAVHKWEEFTSALTPLKERFQKAYTVLHHRRDEAVEKAQQRLEAVHAPVQGLFTYQCQGLQWAEDALRCKQCSAPLKELHLQIMALPRLVADLRSRYGSELDYEEEGVNVRRLRVVEVIPKPRIENKAELKRALDALRGAVTKCLDEADVVELQ